MSDSSSLGITFVFDLLIVSPVLFSARSCMVHSRVKGGGGGVSLIALGHQQSGGRLV